MVCVRPPRVWNVTRRSEEHTSELQSHSEISYAVFCLKKKKTKSTQNNIDDDTPNTTDKVKIDPIAVYISVLSFLFSATVCFIFIFFFFNDTATTEIYTNLNTLSLHDALPISRQRCLSMVNVTNRANVNV